MNNFICYLITVLIISSCAYFRFEPIDHNYPSEQWSKITSEPYKEDTIPGKPSLCLVNCFTPQKKDSVHIQFIEYIGNDYSNPYIKKKSILTQHESSEWRLIENQDNRHPDKEPRLMWCLAEYPEEFIHTYEVLDTHLVKEFRLLDTTITLIEPQSSIKQIEAICPSKINNKLVKEIQKKLYEKRFYYGPIHGQYDAYTKLALIQFQKENNLYVGYISLETLEFLNINYNDYLIN